MPKRPRQFESEDNAVELNGKCVSVPLAYAKEHEQPKPKLCLEEASSSRLDAYIQRWMTETSGARRLSPRAMPPAPPLPTILSLMLPAETSDSAAALRRRASRDDFFGAGGGSAVCGTGVVYDEVMLEHKSSDPKEFERPRRLQRAFDHLQAVGLLDCCRRIPRRSARTKELRLVHTREHIDDVDQLELTAMLCNEGEKGFSVGQDLFANESTARAARMATGCVTAAAQSVVCGEVRNAFALVRPPGHHAGANTASGFCFFNNVAVAVRVAQEELRQRGVSEPRAMVLDWDVHHCDGTESIFYEDSSVVVVSIHQYGHGRGHVLRKMPTSFSSPIDVGDLAALMDAASGDGKENDKEERMEDKGIKSMKDMSSMNENNCTDIHENQGEAKGSPTTVKCEEKYEQDKNVNSGDLVATTSRVRKPVDYIKLNAELDADDDAIAKFLGVPSSEIDSSRDNGNNKSSSSGDSSTSSNVLNHSHSTASAGGSWRFPGDTDGFSFDEKASDGTCEPFYPGTGHLDRVGGDEVHAARGANINIPWPAEGMGDLEYMQVLLDVVTPVAREFRPDIIFISCGFDSAAGDLLGSMRLSPSGYYLMTKVLSALSTRLVVALEGGYNSSNVARCSEAVLRALLECGGAASLPQSSMLWCQAEKTVRRAQRTHKEHWKCFSSDTEKGEEEEEK